MTKALHVCRHLHSAGWRVVLLETTKYWHVGSRLSRNVDRFARVPIPELDPEAYKQAIAGVSGLARVGRGVYSTAAVVRHCDGSMRMITNRYPQQHHHT